MGSPAIRTRSFVGLLAAVALPASAGDTGELWLEPRSSPTGAEIVVRRAEPGPMRFTITSRQAQVLGESFRVIGPFGVPVYTVPSPPYDFGPGETSVTATSMILVPGEYRIRFGGQGLFLKVEIPDSPLVHSGFVFGADPGVVEEPVSGSYTFMIPEGTPAFGITADIPAVGSDDYVELEVRDDLGDPVASLACGGTAGPHPTPCGRWVVDVPEERSEAFWRIDVSHDGDVVLAIDSVPFALATDAGRWFEPHRFVVDPARPGGRDCVASLGGVWTPATAQCSVEDWQFHGADTLEIREGATLTLTGVVRSGGVIDNRGALVNTGRLESLAAFDNRGAFVNRGTLLHTGTWTNHGSASNHGELTNEGSVHNPGTFTNHCSGSISGAGTFSGNPVEPDAEDADGDGVCTVDDCAAGDPAVWSLPGPVPFLALDRDPAGGDASTLIWTPPAEAGGLALTYDVLRAETLDLGAADCWTSGGTATTTGEPDVPVEGTTWFYLARAVNGCGPGSGGTDSSGTPRPAVTCSRFRR